MKLWTNGIKKIRSLREDNDLTQVSIAKMLNVVQKTYSQYELDQITVPIEVIVKLSKFYKVSTDYILLGEDNEKDN